MLRATDVDVSLTFLVLRTGLNLPMDSTVDLASIKKQSQRLRGMSPELPPPSSPKKGKKIATVKQVLDLQPEKSISNAEANATALTSQHEDTNRNDDNISVKSKANSTTSSARRLELEAELQALEELEKLEQEIFRKKKEAILKKLELKKQLANEVGDENQDQGQVITTQPPDVPQASSAAVVDDWFNKMPAAARNEHPYAAAQGIQEMNARMEKFMAR